MLGAEIFGNTVSAKNCNGGTMIVPNATALLNMRIILLSLVLASSWASFTLLLSCEKGKQKGERL